MAFSYVGSATEGANNAGGTTIATGSRSWTAGNLVVVLVTSAFDSSAYVSKVTGPTGNSFFRAGNGYNVTGGMVEIWYSVLEAGGSSAITATYTASSTYRRIWASEYSFSGKCILTSFGTASGTGTTQTSASLTPTSSSNALLIAAYTEWTISAFTPAANWTQQSADSKDYCFTERIISGASGSYSHALTNDTGSCQWGSIIACFEEVSSYPLLAQFATTNGTTLSGGVSLNMPGNIAVGDLLLALCSNDNYGGTNMGISGWTEIFQSGYSGQHNIAAFAKIAVGSDTATLTGASQDYAAVVMRIENHGVATISTDLKKGTAAQGSSTTPNPPSLDAGSSKKHLWIAFAGTDDDDNTANWVQATPFSGVTDVKSAASTSSTMIQVSMKYASSQTEDPGTFTLAATEEWCAQTIAIPPAATIVSVATQSGTATLRAVSLQLGSTLGLSKLSGTATLRALKGVYCGPPFTDDFNRGDNSDLGDAWSVVPGENNFTISSNKAVPSVLDGNDDEEVYYGPNGTFSDDQYASAKVYCTGGSGIDPGMGLMVRGSTSVRTQYRWVINGSGNWALGRINSGSYTQLKTGSTSYSQGDTFRLEATGSSTVALVIKKNGTSLDSYNDSSASRITSGLPGIACSTIITTGSLDDFECGIPTGDQTLGVSKLSGTATLRAIGLQIGSTLGLNLLSGSGTLYSPTVRLGMIVGLSALSATGTLSSLSVSTGSTLSLNKLTGSITLYAPSLSTGSLVSLSMLHGTGTLREVTTMIGVVASLNKLTGTVTIYPVSPSAGALLGLGLLSATSTLRSVSLSTGSTLSVGKLSGTATLYSPSIQTGATLIANILSGVATVRAVSVSAGGSVSFEVGMLHGAASLYSPSISCAVNVELSTINALATVHEVAARLGITLEVNKLTGDVTLYPATDIQGTLVALALLSGSATLHSPSLQLSTTQIVRHLRATVRVFPVSSDIPPRLNMLYGWRRASNNYVPPPRPPQTYIWRRIK